MNFWILFKILWKMEHLLFFHNIFKYMIFQRRRKAVLWSKGLIKVRYHMFTRRWFMWNINLYLILPEATILKMWGAARDNVLNLSLYNSFLVASSNVKLGTGHRKAGTPNPMTAAGKVEHSLVCQTIEEMIGPRLTAEVGNYRIDLLYCYLLYWSP